MSDDLKVFEKRFTFVEAVSLANDGIVFRLNPRFDLRPVLFQIKAWDALGNLCISKKNDKLAGKPKDAQSWWVKARLVPGIYHVEMKLDGHLAYDAELALDEIPF